MILFLSICFLMFAALGTVATFGHIVDQAVYMDRIAGGCYAAAIVVLALTFYVEPNALNMQTVEERVAELELEVEEVVPLAIPDTSFDPIIIAQAIEESPPIVPQPVPVQTTELTANAVTEPIVTAETVIPPEKSLPRRLTMCNADNTSGEIRFCSAGGGYRTA